jgi:hypothetical protein
MHVPVYISSYIHSYLIAITLSCAPRLRGRLLVFDYLTLTSHAMHDARLRRSGILGLQNFRFWSLLLKSNDYACSKRTLRIHRALGGGR